MRHKRGNIPERKHNSLPTHTIQMTEKNRIQALDIMRGITIAGMIMVNNPGSWSTIYAPLRHASWCGLTPTDLVFPFFMFIMGITTFLSLQRYDFKPTATVLKKIITRTLGIILVGIFISWFAHFCYYWNNADDSLGFGRQLLEAANVFPTLRYSGVLHRLAVCYGIVAITATLVNHKRFPWIILVLFATYFVILEAGNGYAYDETNILSIVDRAILTPAHMYNDNSIDPEGILSTIPSIGHVMTGFCVGRMMFRKDSANEPRSNTQILYSKITRLLLFGACILMIGFLFSYACPINKKIWSPSFAMVTCGFGSLLLAVLIWLIDIKGKKSWGRFFEVFGVNPLFMYVMSDIVAILFGSVLFNSDGNDINIIRYTYINLIPLFGENGASCIYALLFVCLNWCIGYPLYKRKIYIKL